MGQGRVRFEKSFARVAARRPNSSTVTRTPWIGGLKARSSRPVVRRDLRAEYEREASRCRIDGERRDWSGDDGGEHSFAHVGVQAICPPVEVALVEFGMGRVVSHFETASPDQIHDL